jgi:hypothetical protein
MRTRASVVLGGLAVVVTLLLGGAARAQEAEVAPTEPAMEAHWYGGRILLADGSAVAVMAAGGGLGSGPLALVGVAGWFVASPLVHAQHAGAGRGLGSFALRAGLPLAGLVLANAASHDCWKEPGASDSCDVGAGLAGLLLGVIGAEILDVAWLARDAHPVEGAHAESRAPQLVFLPQGDGLSVGLVGRF